MSLNTLNRYLLLAKAGTTNSLRVSAGTSLCRVSKKFIEKFKGVLSSCETLARSFNRY